MKWINNELSLSIEKITGIPVDYIRLAFLTIIGILIINFIKYLLLKLFIKRHSNSRDIYLYNKKLEVIITIVIIGFVIIVWEDYLKNIMTIISFVSAGIAIALKDVIVNFFAGIYIRINKPFVLEDRIEINGIKGDIVNIKASSFELLEISERVNGEQSTGRIIHISNSMIFLYPIKNYVKGFKYIWDELVVKITLDSDIAKTKNILFDIISENTVINEIPDKMENQLNNVSTDYRIYYNNLEPIIYTSVVDSHVELYIRFLVHPKKVRNIEDSIWIKIIECYKNGEISLLTK